jgi:hypothetical protein
MTTTNKDLIQDIESSYSFLVGVTITYALVMKLYYEEMKITITSTPNLELSSYIFVVYVILAYVLFKFFKEDMETKSLKLLKLLVVVHIASFVAPLGFFVSFNHPSLLLSLSALFSFPFVFILTMLVLLPFVYDLYLKFFSKKK